MATQIVELTGDEAKLLRSYNAAIAKQVELEQKLARGGQVGDAAGTQITSALQRVERESQKALDGLLRDLDRVGPEGREAAAELRKHLVSAGKLTENSLDSVLKKLQAIDPESAAAAQAIVSNIKTRTEETGTALEKFANNAVAGLGTVVAGYVGVQQAISLVNDYLADQARLIEETRSAHVDLAAEQQEFYKNAVGLSAKDQQAFLTDVLPKIQTDIGFPSRAALTGAAGAAFSSGGTVESTPELLREAGRITKLKPADLDEYVIAALSLQKITGESAKTSLNTLLTAGGVALVKDPRGVQENLPKAVTAAVGTTTGQDPATAAREAAALFGVATEFGSDVTGQSSATAVSRLATYLRELTNDRQDDPGSLIGRLQLVQQDVGLKEAFLDKLPAEAQFQVPFEKLVDANSREFRALLSNVDKIRGGTAEFDKTVGNIETGTQSSILAVAEARNQAAIETARLSEGDRGVLGAVRKIFDDSITNQSRTLVEQFGGVFENSGQLLRRLVGDDSAIEEGVASVAGLENRRLRLFSGGLSEAEAIEERNLAGAIQSLVNLLADSAQRGNLDVAGLPAARRTLAETDAGTDVFRRLEAILAKIEANTANKAPLTKQLSAEQP